MTANENSSHKNQVTPSFHPHSSKNRAVPHLCDPFSLHIPKNWAPNITTLFGPQGPAWTTHVPPPRLVSAPLDAQNSAASTMRPKDISEANYGAQNSVPVTPQWPKRCKIVPLRFSHFNLLLILICSAKN